MKNWGNHYGSLSFALVSCALTVLLAAMAITQYRWATQLAEDDAKVTEAHLRSAAVLFSEQFDGQLTELYIYIQSKAVDAIKTGTPLVGTPPLLGRLYYITKESRANAIHRVERDGSLHGPDPFTSDDQPIIAQYEGGNGTCWSEFWERVPAVVVPIPTKRTGGPPQEPTSCFVARLDQDYLRNTVSEMIRRHFGSDSTNTFDFAVVSVNESAGTGALHTIYGNPLRDVDVKQKFFGFRMDQYPAERMAEQITPSHPFLGWMGPRGSSGPPFGLWELQIVHKSGSIQAAVGSWRRKNILLSVSMEAVVCAAIGFMMFWARRMRRLAEQKMHFIAGVSHELRTPVASMAMLSRNLATGLVSRPEAVKRYGALIHEQSQRLNQMVEQTLQFAGIDSGHSKPVFRETSVRQIVDAAVGRRRSRLMEEGFDIEVVLESDLPPIVADPQWLERAIENLLSNAEKYAKDQRWVRVSGCYVPQSKEILITVQDRGIGIDPADFDQIFEPFSRGRRAVEAQVPGSGIGLTLVRRTMEAHRGCVTFESEPDHGSSFTLHLPAGPAVGLK